MFFFCLTTEQRGERGVAVVVSTLIKTSGGGSPFDLTFLQYCREQQSSKRTHTHTQKLLKKKINDNDDEPLRFYFTFCKYYCVIYFLLTSDKQQEKKEEKG
jgi:hypothetical protein